MFCISGRRAPCVAAALKRPLNGEHKDAATRLLRLRPRFLDTDRGVETFVVAAAKSFFRALAGKHERLEFQPFVEITGGLHDDLCFRGCAVW